MTFKSLVVLLMVLAGCSAETKHKAYPSDLHKYDREEKKMIDAGIYTNLPPGYSVVCNQSGSFAIKGEGGVIYDDGFEFKELSYAPIRAWRIKTIRDGIWASRGERKSVWKDCQ